MDRGAAALSFMGSEGAAAESSVTPAVKMRYNSPVRPTLETSARQCGDTSCSQVKHETY